MGKPARFSIRSTDYQHGDRRKRLRGSGRRGNGIRGDMKTDDLLVIGLVGGAALLIMKASGFSLAGVTGAAGNGGGAGSFAQSIWNPINPLQGTSYNPANPGAYIPNSQLINGTIHDIATGNNSSYYMPTISAITESVLTGGKAQQQTVIKNPGAWW